MKVALYARVSDDKLKENGERRQDIQRQVELLLPYVNGYCETHPEWELVEQYLDDGESAFKEDYNLRPAFRKLMLDIRLNRVHRVYVESLDRWSRRVIEGLTTLNDANNCNCTIVSIAEGEINWTEPQGWFRSLMALGFAEWASREQSWKVTNALNRRRKDKRKVCGFCQVIHMGRHPLTCKCTKCTKKKGRSKNQSEPTSETSDRSQGQL